MNEERTEECLRQMKHMPGHLLLRYSVTDYQVMMETVKRNQLKISSFYQIRCNLSKFSINLTKTKILILYHYASISDWFKIVNGKENKKPYIWVISHEWRKGRGVLTTNETYAWPFVTQIFGNGLPSHDGDCKTFEVNCITQTYQ
jgi:hypothetical protein